ncbi:hypothetical protein BLJ79_15440 [Arthrobacter sp. UCD-GKA]|uniref:GNAT family N-acetyltransferase n=1 Tax=Arthrobacter sp. UCD-GKA TaxID=1913576 RepID=UPI0008DDC980|nr:GNAT family N-acetyltransferase [Arthrobacter sp. UCD-GKA]OIH83465.1 hypothetical protein BLJ79_15440 [Arthrobacter sp. UCD-GKA]
MFDTTAGTPRGASILHFSTASPERFSSLAPDRGADLERLTHNIERGSVKARHLVVASDEDGVDVGRAGLFTHPDGTTVAYAFQFGPGWTDAEELYRVLLDGLAHAARATGLRRAEVSVIDRRDPAPEAKRAALQSLGWVVDSDRLELEAGTEGRSLPVDARGTGPAARPGADPRESRIIEIDPTDEDVVRVMAAAMGNSLDDYDRTRVAEVGAQQAAIAYRDMMADRQVMVPWLAHRDRSGISGIAAIQAYPADWNLGYLAVLPEARRTGVGARLASAVLAATAQAGVPLVTASVARANPPILRTLRKAGFRIASARTDFVLQLDRGNHVA